MLLSSLKFLLDSMIIVLFGLYAQLVHLNKHNPKDIFQDFRATVTNNRSLMAKKAILKYCKYRRVPEIDERDFIFKVKN